MILKEAFNLNVLLLVIFWRKISFNRRTTIFCRQLEFYFAKSLCETTFKS